MLAFSRGQRHVSFYFCVVASSLLFLAAIASSALAQPDTAQRPFLPPGPPPALTSAQLEQLIGGPTLVTFQGREVATAEAVKALLTAAKLPTSPSLAIDTIEAPQKLTVNWNRVPFWKAAQEVETATDLRWAPLLGGSLGLLPASYGELGNLNGRSAAQTPFVAIIATSVSRFSSLTTQALGAKEDAPPVIVSSPNDAATLTLSLYFDPKLEVEGAGVRDLIIQTVEGTVSIPNSKTTSFDVRRLAGNLIAQLPVPLPANSLPGTVFSRVSGTLRTTIISSSQIWNVPDVKAAARTTQTVGNLQYSVEALEASPDQLRLRVTVQNTQEQAGLIAFNSPRLLSGLRVRDAQGQELSRSSTATRLAIGPNRRPISQSDLTFRLKNAQGGTISGPFSLEWLLISQLSTFDVPFEVRNVPIP